VAFHANARRWAERAVAVHTDTVAVSPLCG
jgi:hypothetical protein